MTLVAVLSTFLTIAQAPNAAPPAAAPRSVPSQKAFASLFTPGAPVAASGSQPQLKVRIEPAQSSTRGNVVRRDSEEREIVCGMVVVKKPSTLDSGMLLPRRETGAAVRRIEPDTCTAKKIVPAK